MRVAFDTTFAVVLTGGVDFPLGGLAAFTAGLCPLTIFSGVELCCRTGAGVLLAGLSATTLMTGAGFGAGCGLASGGLVAAALTAGVLSADVLPEPGAGWPLAGLPDDAADGLSRRATASAGRGSAEGFPFEAADAFIAVGGFAAAAGGGATGTALDGDVFPAPVILAASAVFFAATAGFAAGACSISAGGGIGTGRGRAEILGDGRTLDISVEPALGPR